jgi:hypothetical protein
MIPYLLKFDLPRRAICPGCLCELTQFAYVFHQNVAVCPSCRDEAVHTGINDAIFVMRSQTAIQDRLNIRGLLFFVPRDQPTDPLQFSHPSNRYAETGVCDPKWTRPV